MYMPGALPVSFMVCSWPWLPLLCFIYQHSLICFAFCRNLLKSLMYQRPLPTLSLCYFSFHPLYIFFLSICLISHLDPEFFRQFNINFNLQFITQGIHPFPTFLLHVVSPSAFQHSILSKAFSDRYRLYWILRPQYFLSYIYLVTLLSCIIELFHAHCLLSLHFIDLAKAKLNLLPFYTLSKVRLCPKEQGRPTYQMVTSSPSHG